MSCCGGLNAIVPLNVPAVNGEGLPTGVGNLVANKTVSLSGPFTGEYLVLGSQDGINYVPICKFTGQGQPGDQAMKHDVDFALSDVKVRRLADGAAPLITVTSKLTCACPVIPPPPIA